MPEGVNVPATKQASENIKGLVDTILEANAEMTEVKERITKLEKERSVQQSVQQSDQKSDRQGCDKKEIISSILREYVIYKRTPDSPD